MEWLSYHLMGDVVTQYGYIVECIAIGFICNIKQKDIVVLAIIRPNTIPETKVLICMDKNVAYVEYMNNRLKVWTIHAPNSKWTRHNCVVTSDCILYKYTFKVFKIFHPDVDNGVIIYKQSQNTM